MMDIERYILVGNFNIVLSQDEKRIGKLIRDASQEEVGFGGRMGIIRHFS